MGGTDLPVVAMVGVNEELGKTITPYDLPPDSPNLRMLMLTANDAQRERYLGVVVPGEAPQVYSLGPFPYNGPWAYGGGLWRDTYGVIPDGTGGVLWYAGPEIPWRRLP